MDIIVWLIVGLVAGLIARFLVPALPFVALGLATAYRRMPALTLGLAIPSALMMVTASLVYFSQADNALILPVTALWLVTVPLMDMLATMLRRAKHGHKLMLADRSHLHHTLMDMGFSARQTLANFRQMPVPGHAVSLEVVAGFSKKNPHLGLAPGT